MPKLTLPQREVPIKPAAIYAYFDKVQFWLPHPIDIDTTVELRAALIQRRIYVGSRPARFNGNFQQRTELRQPTESELRWLASRSDALINRVEIAIDLVLESIDELADAFKYLHRHFARRWHGKKQKIKMVPRNSTRVLTHEIGEGHGRYDAPRGAPNRTVFYKEQFCRVTGELNSLHVEWRCDRLRAVRNIGIESGTDLINFDHRGFWRKRFLLYDIDRERLGRLIRNSLKGVKRGASPQGNHCDRRTLHVDTVQEVIDQYGPRFRVHRALVPISIERLLSTLEQDRFIDKGS